MRLYILLLFIIPISSCNTQDEMPSLNINAENNKQANFQIDSLQQLLQEGDIVFRGGTDIKSDIIREFSEYDKTFTHCGIVLKENNSLKVTHILGGVTNPSGSIITESLSSFISFPQNECAGVYASHLNTAQCDLIIHFIDSLKAQKITFDLKFNLFTKDKLYCTELLADAVLYATNKKIIQPTSYNLKNTKYFFLNNKGDEFLYYPIDKFQQRLTKKKICYFPNCKEYTN